jgi:hypothetical protein
MPTEAELAAIAAALSVVLETPVTVQGVPAPSAWALASRQEAVGRLPAVAERASLRGPLAP